MIDTFLYAAENARVDCPTCHGKGVYMYDHNHSAICRACCRHDLGWWKLGPLHGGDGERWACRAGCGHTLRTSDLPFDPEALRCPAPPEEHQS